MPYLFKRYYFIIFLMIGFFLNTQENINICLSNPFIRNESSLTAFYNKHFTFEMLFNKTNEKINFEILNLEENNEEDFLKKCKNKCIETDLDYLFFSTVYSTEKNIYFRIELINPYNNIIVYSKLFINKIDYNVNEILTDNCIQILNILDSISLKKIEKRISFKNRYNKEKEENKTAIFTTKTQHEIFFLNGFFKNHANIMSFLEIYTGYNFAPFDFLNFEVSVFLGYGNIENFFSFDKISLTNFYVGGNTGFNFFLSGIIEPSIGLNFDFNYIIDNDVYFSIPINLGIKFYIGKKNVIRFNSTFQFISYDFNKFKWENNFILGFLLGYAKKI